MQSIFENDVQIRKCNEQFHYYNQQTRWIYKKVVAYMKNNRSCIKNAVKKNIRNCNEAVFYCRTHLNFHIENKKTK